MEKVLVVNLDDAVNIAWQFLDGVAEGCNAHDVRKWVAGEMANASFEIEAGDDREK